MSLSLTSDFEDYYDDAFSEQGAPFVRLAQHVRTPSQILAGLEHVGMRVPLHGPVHTVVRKLCRQWMQNEPVSGSPNSALSEHLRHLFFVVVFLNPATSGGDNKRLVSAADAFSLYPDAYCVEYVEPPRPGLAWQYLQIGKRRWWLEMESSSDWRSDRGDRSTKILSEDSPGFLAHFPMALFAIDFIPGRHLYAINFHQAPRILGTGIERQVSPDEVVSLLAEATREFGTRSLM